MTARDMYEYALVELNKLEAPSLLLEDYNYFINKAIQQHINLSYAKFEVDQQATDDLRVLKAATVIVPSKLSLASDLESMSTIIGSGMWKSNYYVDLPSDYTHMLSCVVEYTVQNSNFKCYTENEKVYFAARRLTTDMYSQILNNAYMRPMYKRPYYYLNNINTSNTLVTNTSMDDSIENLQNSTSTLIDSKRVAYDRLANPSIVRLELRFGTDDTIFKPTNLYIDYLKAPMYIRLTQEQINNTIDTSQILEFPDYVCFEIVNIFTRLLMENASDPRLQTNMPINQTILNPAATIQAKQQQN